MKTKVVRILKANNGRGGFIYAPMGWNEVFNDWDMLSGKAFDSRERAIQAAEWYCKMTDIGMVLED